MQQMDPSSLKKFSDIAFRCLQNAREERPTMSHVVENLEIALESQEFPDLRLELLARYGDILKAADPLLSYIYRTGNQLKELLSKGLIVHEGKTWFSINTRGEHTERIYIEACLSPYEIQADSLCHPDDLVNSRFPGGRCYVYHGDFKAHARAQYLLPQITYTVNLVFRYEDQSDVGKYAPIRYKLDGEDVTKVFIVYPTDETEDGWFIAPLCHFTSQHKTADLQFIFEECWKKLLVAGVEFQPLEENVDHQVIQEYQDIVEGASQSLFYKSLEELKNILSIGVHLNSYKTWFSLKNIEDHCEMISMEYCLIPNEDYTDRYKSCPLSRFPAGLYQTNNKGFKIHVKTQLLSTLITYSVNLVFDKSYSTEKGSTYVGLTYRLRGETITSTVYVANQREDSLYVAELYHFTGDGSNADLEINFDDHGTNIQVEGILFQPLEKSEDHLLEDEKVKDMTSMTESDAYWEQIFPEDRQEILELSKDTFQCTTRIELYSILCKGFMSDNGQQWFTADKNGKICHMLCAKATFVKDNKNLTWESSDESRFGEVLVITSGNKFEIKTEIRYTLLSPDTKYAGYLVYKLPQDQRPFEDPLKGSHKEGPPGDYVWFANLVSPPNTPVIGPKVDENTYNPPSKRMIGSLPQQRRDGWMDVETCKFFTQSTAKGIYMHHKLEHPPIKDLSGLIVQGFEFRPR